MKNKVYFEEYDVEENNKIDIIRQFIGVDTYASLSKLLYKIENGLHITDREKWHLKTYYGFEAETITVSEIKEYVNLFYKMFENTIKMSAIELKNAVQDLIWVIGFEFKEFGRDFKNKCVSLKKKLLG